MPARHLVVAAALALVGSACIRTEGATSDVVQVDPPRPAIEEPIDPGLVDPIDGGAAEPGDGGAVRVQPHDGQVDGSRAVPWDRATYRRAENAIDVYWWSGVEPCTVLESVEVDVRDDEVVVTVFEGAPPEAATTSCVALGVYKTTTVTLDVDLGSRRIVDGSS